MKRNLDDIALLVQVIEYGGFAATGRAAGCTPSSVSKRISRLEEQLGISLLNRTTRKVALTVAGRAFYESCSIALAEIDKAEDIAKSSRKVPQGLLRIRVPQAFGKMQVAPLIPKFLSLHPHVTIELLFGNFSHGLIEDEIDVLISPVDPSDNSLASRVLAPFERVTCASPEYIARYGKPNSFEDLTGHNCLTFSDRTVSPNEWTYHLPDGIKRVRVTGNLMTNNGDALLRAALEGLGIAHLPSFAVEAELATGHLEMIFRDHIPNLRAQPTIKAYYAPAKQRLSRVQVFVDFLIDALKKESDNAGQQVLSSLPAEQ